MELLAFVAAFARRHWRAYLSAALMLVGIAVILANPEPRPAEIRAHERQAAAWISRRAGLSGSTERVASWLYGAVVAPFADFLRRPGWLSILLFVLLLVAWQLGWIQPHGS